ncbi:kynurenine formamidase-like [Hibiscus syriacus]|uniref:Kynurenine formamidase-like n=1 Tax=Hibiscus syriacus TaxID=106335 RepID=A0A6A2YTR9_HIBSY|nr:16 kDa phloem protein 2-like [Hibiscus syriacus]KAE8682773.1 kynurenine formamidase-like [Hibiscus syriacus]
MSILGIHGLTLEVTVIGCYNLEDKEWVSRQDPYVCLDYGSAKYRTKTCTDGGKNPTFQEKFIFTLIEGLRELNVGVWNSNTLVADDFIGSGRIQLHKVLSQGFEDCTWPLQSKTGRHSGEVRLIMHYPNARQPQNWMTKGAPSFPGYAPSAPLAQVTPYAHPPPAPHPTPMPYAVPGLSSYNLYPPSTTTYPPSPFAGYPPQATPASYNYPPQVYPPPPQPSHFYPPAPAGIYPPPPY